MMFLSVMKYLFSTITTTITIKNTITIANTIMIMIMIIRITMIKTMITHYFCESKFRLTFIEIFLLLEREWKLLA